MTQNAAVHSWQWLRLSAFCATGQQQVHHIYDSKKRSVPQAIAMVGDLHLWLTGVGRIDPVCLPFPT